MSKNPLVISPEKLKALSWPSLNDKIETVQQVVDGLKSPDHLMSKGFETAIVAVGTFKKEDYPQLLKQLLHERKRRMKEMQEAQSNPAPWTPFQRAYVDPADLNTAEAHRRYEELARNDTQGRTAEDYRAIYASLLDDEMWRNSRYQVAIRRTMADDGEGGLLEMAHLSIKRIDQLPIHDWRDLQRIKNELVGPNCEGIELYPAEDRVVDTANQYHIWCVNSGTFRFPFGWHEGALKVDANDAEVTGAKQRKFDHA